MDKWVIRKNVKNPTGNGETGTSRDQLNLNPSQEIGTEEIRDNILTPPDHINLTLTTVNNNNPFNYTILYLYIKLSLR
ncbi:unnamed protein product [Ceutorhynchus assimilis]|uniref:Uncharacterized protein n=1 Tax=Ceutorhynchus assimilis TaxID=467358 RepID=A0A9N9MF65_9CUCU|nr:unnamed protein product [Ceutorhynchus assimilis]